jgi:hypothetical protein
MKAGSLLFILFGRARSHAVSCCITIFMRHGCVRKSQISDSLTLVSYERTMLCVKLVDKQEV